MNFWELNDPLTLALNEQLAACTDTYQFMQEENRLLKRTSEPPDAAMLERKRELLGRLDSTNRILRATDKSNARNARALVNKSQQLVMKALLLDRENEQLLLKVTLSRPAPAPPSVPRNHLQRIYGRQ